MKVGVRTAAGDDLAAVARLARAALTEMQDERKGGAWARTTARTEPLEPALEAAIESEASAVVVGLIDDVPVGYAVATAESTGDDDGLLCVVHDIFVEREARAVGVGAALLDDVVAWARHAGCWGMDAVALPGMRETKNFFEAHGLTARAIVVHRDLGASS